MTKVNNVELLERPNKSELFIGLAERLLVCIHEFRLSQNLDTKHLDILNYSILNFINPDSDHVDYFSKIADKDSFLDSVYEGFMLMMGWDVFVRLEKDLQSKLSRGELLVSEIDLSFLIIPLSTVICDSEKCSEYLNVLAQRNIGYLSSQINELKTGITELNSVMQLSLVNTQGLQKKLKELKAVIKSEVFQTLAFEPRHYIKKLPPYLQFKYRHLFETPDYANVTSHWMGDSKIRTAFKEFLKIFHALNSSKTFDINSMSAIQVMYSFDHFLSVFIKRNNSAWLDTMVDSLIFDFDAETSEEWSLRLRQTKQYLDILLPEFELVHINKELVMCDKSSLDEEQLLEYGINKRSIQQSYQTQKDKYYKSYMGLYYSLNEEVSISIPSAHSGLIYMGSFAQLSDFEPVFIQSRYHNLLRSVSHIIVQKNTELISDSTILNTEMLKDLICMRLDYLVQNAYFFNSSRSAQISFFQQVFMGHNVQTLIDINYDDRFSYFTSYLQSILTQVDQVQLPYMLESITSSSLCSVLFKSIPSMDDLILLSAFGLKKDHFNRKFVDHLDTQSEGELTDFCDLLFDDTNFNSQLSEQLEIYESHIFADQIKTLMAETDYVYFGEQVELIKQLNSGMFFKYLSDKENCLGFFEYLKELSANYRVFITNASVEEYESVKKLTFLYLKELVSEVKFTKHIAPEICSQLIREIDETYRLAAEKFDIKQMYYHKTVSMVARGNSLELVVLRGRQKARLNMIDITFCYLWNKMRQESGNSIDLFKYFLSKLDDEYISRIIERTNQANLLRSFFLDCLKNDISLTGEINDKIVNLFYTQLESVHLSTLRNRSLELLVKKTALDLIYSTDIQIFELGLQEKINDSFAKSSIRIDNALIISMVEEIVKSCFKMAPLDISIDSIFEYYTK